MDPRTSPRFCRPLGIQFLRKIIESTQPEIILVENQIYKLLPFESTFEENNFKISYIISLTIIDKKVCSAITRTKSSQRCSLHGQHLKNNFEDRVRFRLSTLPAWIRFFECILYLSYNISVKN